MVDHAIGCTVHHACRCIQARAEQAGRFEARLRSLEAAVQGVLDDDIAAPLEDRDRRAGQYRLLRRALTESRRQVPPPVMPARTAFPPDPQAPRVAP